MRVALVALVVFFLVAGLHEMGLGLTNALGVLIGPRQDVSLLILGAHEPLVIGGGSAWWTFSSVLLHHDALHLVLCGLSLVAVGWIVEGLHGSGSFPVLVALVALVAGVLSPEPLQIGASTVVWGLAGVAAVGLWQAGSLLGHEDLARFRRSAGACVVLAVLATAVWALRDVAGHGAALAVGLVAGAVIGGRLAPGQELRARADRAGLVLGGVLWAVVWIVMIWNLAAA